jgi:hypothetical protein
MEEEYDALMLNNISHRIPKVSTKNWLIATKSIVLRRILMLLLIIIKHGLYPRVSNIGLVLIMKTPSAQLLKKLIYG